ncbi:uncharacterized protein LOC142343027 [Convolutriloba macropyga]|uniref:uncharacterized protein LOC142343027 n=1 Tax=Convolutriloba macropyga TaxID=536237 RepID=UPI003F51DDD8
MSLRIAVNETYSGEQNKNNWFQLAPLLFDKFSVVMSSQLLSSSEEEHSRKFKSMAEQCSLELTEGLVDWASKYVDAGLIVNAQSVGFIADTLAVKIGLQMKGDTAQTAAYIITYAAVIEFANNVFGIGASFSSMDLTGFTLAQIKQTLQEIKKMVSVVLDTPLKTAIDKMMTALNLLEKQMIDKAVEKLKDVEKDAITAYYYQLAVLVLNASFEDQQLTISLKSVGQGNAMEHLEKAIMAKKLVICSKLCIYSYHEPTKSIRPFDTLNTNEQAAIADELERDCRELLGNCFLLTRLGEASPKQFKKLTVSFILPGSRKETVPLLDYKDSVKIGYITFHRKQKRTTCQELTNTVLKIAYSYISQGKGYTNPKYTVHKSKKSIKITIDTKLLPLGFRDRASISVGRDYNDQKHRSFTVLTKTIFRNDENLYIDGRYISLTETSDSVELLEHGLIKVKVSTENRNSVLFTKTGIAADKFIPIAQYNLIYNHEYEHSFVYQNPINKMFLYKHESQIWYVSGSVGSDEEESVIVRSFQKNEDYEPCENQWEYFFSDGCGLQEWRKGFDDVTNFITDSRKIDLIAHGKFKASQIITFTISDDSCKVPSELSSGSKHWILTCDGAYESGLIYRQSGSSFVLTRKDERPPAWFVTQMDSDQADGVTSSVMRVFLPEENKSFMPPLTGWELRNDKTKMIEPCPSLVCSAVL